MSMGGGFLAALVQASRLAFSYGKDRRLVQDPDDGRWSDKKESKGRIPNTVMAVVVMLTTIKHLKYPSLAALTHCLVLLYILVVGIPPNVVVVQPNNPTMRM